MNPSLAISSHKGWKRRSPETVAGAGTGAVAAGTGAVAAGAVAAGTGAVAAGTGAVAAGTEAARIDKSST